MNLKAHKIYDSILNEMVKAAQSGAFDLELIKRLLDDKEYSLNETKEDLSLLDYATELDLIEIYQLFTNKGGLEQIILNNALNSVLKSKAKPS